MKVKASKCIKFVSEQKKCIYCTGPCVKHGKSSTKQRYRCKKCNKTFLSFYSYHAYHIKTNASIADHLKEGCGIRSVSRLLKISVNTVLKRIFSIARSIRKPIVVTGKEYELDEICTYIRKKTSLAWITYAIRRDTKEVIDFAVGGRTQKTLKLVTDTLLLSSAKKVYTDKLQHYQSLLPKEIHCTQLHGTNHIERMNLTLRTHLRRLNRRTICFSKSAAVLAACLKIYFWL